MARAVSPPEAPLSVARAADRVIRVLQVPFVPPLILGVLGVLIVEWFATDAHWLNAISLMVVYAVLTVGLNFAQGQSGLFTMGTAAFMGVGGYSTAYFTTAQHWSPILALLAGIVIALAIGGLFALLTLRISDIYLAIATLALVQIFGGMVLAYSTVTNGVNGITSVPPLGIGGLVADDVLKNALYYVRNTDVYPPNQRRDLGQRRCSSLNGMRFAKRLVVRE